MLSLLASFAVVIAAFYAIGSALQWLAKPSAQDDDNVDALIDSVNALLPQTQCAQCGFPGCRPYAEAIINKQQPINQCPPGGDATIQQLAQLLGREATPLDDTLMPHKKVQVAYIQEDNCIGCVLCIKACPVDAIVGANRFMHTVIADECTGCELCLPPCPVDCIELRVLRPTSNL